MKTEDGYILSIDDSYEENALHLEIETDESCIPQRVEIYYLEKMVMSIEIQNFSVL